MSYASRYFSSLKLSLDEFDLEDAQQMIFYFINNIFEFLVNRNLFRTF